MNQADLRRMADERVRDAKALMRGKRWGFAYYAAGYSIECALKSCVLAQMIHTGEVFRESWSPKDFRTHDFEKLILRAGLGNELRARRAASRAAGDPFDSYWTKVEEWDSESRYEFRTEIEARELLTAIDDRLNGVLRWLKTYW